MNVQRQVRADARTTVIKGTLKQQAAKARKRRRNEEKATKLKADAEEYGCTPDELQNLRFQSDVVDKCGLRKPATKARVGAPIAPPNFNPHAVDIRR